jgi:PhzF family phenazine biosynthesis protein
MSDVVYAVFSDGPGGGNPCPVIPAADTLSVEEMLSIAHGHGHESVFLLSPTTPDASVRLRYFVPAHEMEMCVHATVAAVTWLAEERNVRPGEVRVETLLGVLSTTLSADGEVTVEQFPPVISDAVPHAASEIAQALGCDAGHLVIADTPRSVSVSRAKLLVELDSVSTLQSLHPDAARIRRICEELDVTGLYPFATPDHDGRAWARQFPRDSGYPEDAATGVAAAALGALLARRESGDGSYQYAIHQGQAMGHPSRMTVHVTRGEHPRVAVRGRALRK